MHTIPTAEPDPELRPSDGVHVVLGKGPVGSATAAELVSAGCSVRMLSRSGAAAGTASSSGPVEHVAVDAADPTALTQATRDAAVIYNCANPTHYHRWAEQWPPMAAALLDAAEIHGAVLVTMSNLYGYGRVDGPLTVDLPLRPSGEKGRIRARMWSEALARHDAGRVRATEARAADFYGPGVTDGGFLGNRAVPRILAGRSVTVLGDPDQPHSFTYVPDVARTLVRLGSDPAAWGRPWHVPSAPAPTLRTAVASLCDAAGVEPVPVRRIPWWAVRIAGVAVPMLREFGETRHQLDGPFVIDGSATTAAFGVTATPFEVGAAATVDWFRAGKPALSRAT